MEKRITKKRFQELLNAWDVELRGNRHGQIINGHKNNQFHQVKRLYGDYLRAQDIEMFNANYKEFLNGSYANQEELARYKI